MFKLSAGALTVALIFGGVAAGAPSPNEELPAGPVQEKAVAACLSCHEARIIVQQRLSKAAWTKEMDKMIKWGAEVDSKDRDGLIHYFSTSFGPDQATYEAPRTAAHASPKVRLKGKH